MTTDTPSLLELSRSLATDDATKAEFRADPEGFLAQHGYGDLAPDDLATAMVHVADALPVALASAVTAAIDPAADLADQLAGLAGIDPDDAEARWVELTSDPAAIDDLDTGDVDLDEPDADAIGGLDPADLDATEPGGMDPAVEDDRDADDGDEGHATGGLAPARAGKDLDEDRFGAGGQDGLDDGVDEGRTVAGFGGDDDPARMLGDHGELEAEDLGGFDDEIGGLDPADDRDVVDELDALGDAWDALDDPEG
jgi:hypothetical protein